MRLRRKPSEADRIEHATTQRSRLTHIDHRPCKTGRENATRLSFNMLAYDGDTSLKSTG